MIMLIVIIFQLVLMLTWHPVSKDMSMDSFLAFRITYRFANILVQNFSLSLSFVLFLILFFDYFLQTLECTSSVHAIWRRSYSRSKVGKQIVYDFSRVGIDVSHLNPRLCCNISATFAKFLMAIEDWEQYWDLTKTVNFKRGFKNHKYIFVCTQQLDG